MGKLFVLVGDSGSGKTTVAEGLSHVCDRLITSTTREKRKNEVDGFDYYFRDRSFFDNNEMIEVSTVFGETYGVPLSEYLSKMKYGNGIIILDKVGYKKVKDRFGDSVVGVYLDRDYRTRAESIEDRNNKEERMLFSKAPDGIKYKVSNNGDISETILAIEKIIKKETLKYPVIAVDFDGTIAVDNFPKIGDIKPLCREVLFEYRRMGGKVIIWTCRTDERLREALIFLDKNGVEFDTVGENTIGMKTTYGNDPRKVGADLYIDDKNIFCKEISWEKIGKELGVINF